MITRKIGLIEGETLFIKKLMEVCEIADGSTPSIQMIHTLNCHPAMKSWIRAFNQDRLVGVLSIFQPQEHEVEISGCVDPEYRGKGIFKALVEQALSEISTYGTPNILWMVNHSFAPSVAIMQRKGLALKQTEYTMRYFGDPKTLKSSHAIALRRADISDCVVLAAIQASAFSEKKDEALALAQRLLEDVTRENFLGLYEGKPLSAVSVFVEDSTANINALAVLPDHQGKGIGRAFMVSLIEYYADLGYELTLEVNSINARAFELYKHLGFQVLEAVDYYY